MDGFNESIMTVVGSFIIKTLQSSKPASTSAFLIKHLNFFNTFRHYFWNFQVVRQKKLPKNNFFYYNNKFEYTEFY